MSSPKTVILGVYTQTKQKEDELIVVYANADFVNKKANNSSAHIYTSDLKKANSEGYFSKVDKKKNFVPGEIIEVYYKANNKNTTYNY